MTERTELVYMYLLRLPGFLSLYGVLTILMHLLMPHARYVWFFPLFFILYTALIAAKEIVDNKAVSSLIMWALTLLAMLIVWLIPGYKPWLPMVLFILCTCVYALLNFVYEYIALFFNTALVYNMLVLAFNTNYNIQIINTTFTLSFIAVIICKYICLNLSRLENFALTPGYNRQSGTAFSLLFRRNGKLMAIYMLTLCAVMSLLLIPNYPRMKYETSPEEYTEEEAKELIQDIFISNSGEVAETSEEVLAEGEPDILDIKLPAAVRYAAMAIITAAVIFILLKLYGREKRLKKSFKNFDEEFELSEADALKRKGRALTHIQRTNKAVRRMFVKKVREHRKLGLKLKTSSTAESISRDISKTEDINLLNKTYHLARYSGETISDDMLNRLKHEK